MTNAGNGLGRTLNDLHPETLIIVDVPVESSVHWMEPRDYTVSEIVGAKLCGRQQVVFAGFADGELWKVTAESGAGLQSLVDMDPSAERGFRERLLSPFGVKVSQAVLSRNSNEAKNE